MSLQSIMRTSNSRLSFSAFLLALVTVACPYPLTGCSVTEFGIPLPTGQTNLTTPSDASPEFIAVPIL